LYPGLHIFYNRLVDWSNELQIGTLQILKFRWVGQRITDTNNPGYRSPTFIEDNWELVYSTTVDDWVDSPSTLGLGAWLHNDQKLILSFRNISDYISLFYWDGNTEQVSLVEEEDNPVNGRGWASMNRILAPLGADLTINYDSRPYSLKISASNRWIIDPTIAAGPSGWSLGAQASVFDLGPNYRFYDSNGYMLAAHMQIESQSEEGIIFSYGDIWCYQLPNRWFRTDFQAVPYSHNILALDNATFNYTHRRTALSKDSRTGYIMRKSDKTIWRFLNHNPATSFYNNIFGIVEKPVQPSDPTNPLYATYNSPGPPIAGDQTWYNLIIVNG
jgi:hypothetical protein